MKWFLFTSQRHPEHRGAAARSHEEDSLQHPGTEGWDQLPQRVLSVIQASFQSNVHWLIMPFHWWASRTGEAWDWATPGFVVFSMEQRGRTEDSSEPIRLKARTLMYFMMTEDTLFIFIWNILYEQEPVMQYRKWGKKMGKTVFLAFLLRDWCFLPWAFSSKHFLSAALNLMF